MDGVDKIKFGFSTVLRVLLAIAATISLYNKDWINLLLALIALFLTILPALIEKRFKVDYPSEFEILILIFIYLSVYLGEIRYFYYKFWWWDIFLHGISGIIIGVIGFSLIYLLNKERTLSIELSHLFIAIFSFSFAIAIGTIWEIFEFFIDSFLGLNMQKSGLIDTMWDLIVDTLGALLASISGYLYLKGNLKIFERIEKGFIEKNPRFNK